MTAQFPWRQASVPAADLSAEIHGTCGTVLADPPWRFQNRTGKMAPEHRRQRRYETMCIKEIKALPVSDLAPSRSHL